MSDLDQQLRQLFRDKEAEVGPPPAMALQRTSTTDAHPSSGMTTKVRPLFQIAAIAAVVALVVFGVNVLRSSVTPEPASTPEQTWADALGDVSPLTMPKTLPQLPAQTNLPTSIPGPNDDLPSLLDDLPGRVLMTWYPAPASGCFEGVQGWARETIDFYGQDGRWRRLNLVDLGLPESTWPGCSNGPGSLSPDGRWWTIGAKGLFVLLDLETGDLVTKKSSTPWGGTWTHNSQQLVKFGNRKGAALWQVPGIHVMDLPGMEEPGSDPLPLPGGGYLASDAPAGSSDADSGSMTLRYYTPTYDLVKTRAVPVPPGQECVLEGVEEDRVGMVCLAEPSKKRRVLYVLDESSWQVEAALEVPPGASAYPAAWLNPELWALWKRDSVGMWQIDEGEVGTVLPLPDESKSAKYFAFNQFGLAGDLLTD